MIWRAFAILVVSAISLTSPATRAENAPAQAEVIAARPKADACNPPSTHKATVHDVAVSSDAKVGQCVEVAAVMRGPYLYGGIDGLYGPRTDSIDPSSNGNAVGLDFGGAKDGRTTGYFKVIVTGRIGDCERTRQIVRSFGDFAMTLGYCHSFDGRYLQVTGVKVASQAHWQRQLRSDRHPDYGDLTEAPPNWPYRRQVQDWADRLVDALQLKDSKALLALHTPEPDSPINGDRRALLRLLIRDPASPFVAVGHRPGKPQTTILIDKSYSSDERYQSVVCVCRLDDCTGRWPIASFDADNLPSRPYACSRLTPYVIYPDKEATTFVTRRQSYGLREPSAR